MAGRAGKLRLARYAPPALRHYRSGNHRDNSAQQQRPVPCPHPPLPALSGDQSARVIGNPTHSCTPPPARRPDHPGSSIIGLGDLRRGERVSIGLVLADRLQPPRMVNSFRTVSATQAV